MKLKTIIYIAVGIVLAGGAYVGIRLFTTPTMLQGDADQYIKITLQLTDRDFYDVRIPTEAVLKDTDGQSLYVFDKLTVGIQDTMPTCIYKVNVCDRWVFAESQEDYLLPTVKGFEIEQPYTVGISLKGVPKDLALPKKKAEGFRELQTDKTVTFGGNAFVRHTSNGGGDWDSVIDALCLKMTQLYNQPLTSYYRDDICFLMVSGEYIIAAINHNYNTSEVMCGCGTQATGQIYNYIVEVLHND